MANTNTNASANNGVPEKEARSSSSSSNSLDPYYFGLNNDSSSQSPADSPVLPPPHSLLPPSTSSMSNHAQHHIYQQQYQGQMSHSNSSSPLYPRTPDMTQPRSTSSSYLHTGSGYHSQSEYSPVFEPVTPGRDPAAIDRRMLVGVGELATPRWAKSHDRRHGEEGGDVEESTRYLKSHEARVDEEDEVEEEQELEAQQQRGEEENADRPGSGEQASPDSPWTIEAMDGEEISEREEVVRQASPEPEPLPQRPLRKKPSAAEESGGEEILYPRKSHATMADIPPLPRQQPSPTNLVADRRASLNAANNPPSSFSSSPRKARKRTSDEFEKDSAGSLLSKRPPSLLTSALTGGSGSGSSGPGSPRIDTTPKDKERDRRKHRSLIVGGSSSSSSSSPIMSTGKPRRRESTGLTHSHSQSQSISAGTPRVTRDRERERHSRQLSGPSAAGSGSSSSEHPPVPRRALTTDYSHLPPSPASSSIQQFLRQSVQGAPASGRPGSPISVATSVSAPSASSVMALASPQQLSSSPTSDKLAQSHSSPQNAVVAHSLLRGTQEGWSGMDDETTASMLRKLDGLSGKSARARQSFGAGSTSSRNASPSRRFSSGSALAGQMQWEGVESVSSPASKERKERIRRSDVDLASSGGEGRDSERERAQRKLNGLGISGADDTLGKSEDTPIPVADQTPKKAGSSNTRMSFTPKRTSGSSTVYTMASTPTTTASSRDSASLTTSTSNTSLSALSSAPSLSKQASVATLEKGKNKRSSAGSDTSSVHSNSEGMMLKDRVAFLASGQSGGEKEEAGAVPPVPPLPKDLSNFKTHSGGSPSVASSVTALAASANTLSFPSVGRTTPQEERRKESLDLPAPRFITTAPSAPTTPARQTSYTAASKGGNLSAPEPMTSSPQAPPAVHKTPSKKWSFSNALNIKLSSSPSSGGENKLSKRKSIVSSQTSTSSPRNSVTASLRKSSSREQAMPVPVGSHANWATRQDAMGSAASLTSLSSTGGSPGAVQSPVIRERGSGPLSPSAASLHKQSSKRLTPSSIPFFRRSSSQSMQLPPASATTSFSIPSANSSSDKLSGGSGVDEYGNMSTYAGHPSSSVSIATSGVREKKTSVLSLGLPSLLKSSSRRSLHSDGSKDSKDGLKSPKERKAEAKAEAKEAAKKSGDEKEGRLSVLMGRKRGKTLSSADPGRPKPSAALPPMQISALAPATAQRVANLKSSSNSLSTPASPNSTTPSGSSKTSSRLTSQTVSSMQKQSDSSLRSSRNQLPTIAGSPSVATGSAGQSHHSRESTVTSSSLPKETPTKIPRIASRTSTAPSPTVKSVSAIPRGRVSASGTTATPGGSLNPSPSTTISANEFGVMDPPALQEESTPKATALGSRASLRASPSSTTTRLSSNRLVSAPATSSTQTFTGSNTMGSMLRKSTRESMGFPTPRKASTGNVQTTSEAPSSGSHRFSALSPSKGLKLLSPKISLSTSRLHSSSGTSSASSSRQSMVSPSASQQSLTTPSPSPSFIDDEEALGDKEMMNCMRKQHARKLAAGSSQQELDNLLKFPEPIPPGIPTTPEDLLDSPNAQHLSEYEREEVLDFPAVYYYGKGSKKKMARPDVSTNNYSYDDDRGDYLVVNGDHLAYRYEIIDILGKGSFGQVLHCRDHCTGESTAIKIIRNKKRFHHQALVEIKILDNLRKWDPHEQHYVIKMTDHFYFRNHLCIAMELLSINLYELIKANQFSGFSTTLIRRFTSQMLLSLVLMRQHRVVHCDLKPENILLRHPCKSGLKVIDFGSSCFEHEKIYTYIQSRFYRSPEVILGMNYHMAIDMWSLGCILAELYTGFPIFPGENEQEQLSCIMEVLGVPDKEFVNKSSRKRLFFEPNGAPRQVTNSKGRKRRPGTKTLSQVLRSNDEEFVDFIAKCLCWDPERRLKPQNALKHPFIVQGRQQMRPSISSSTSKSLLSSSTLGGSRSKFAPETPKKSQIGAPAPLTARSARTSGSVPTTPGSSHTSTLPTSTRSYRSTQGSSYTRIGVTASAK